MKFELKTIKLIAVSLFVLFLGVSLLTNNPIVTKTSAELPGAPTGRTGAPGETTCTSCHNQNTGSGQVTITGPATYTPGQTYPIQVQNISSDSTRQAWGFEITSLTSANAAAGTFAITDATNTWLRTAGNGRRYVTHTEPGTYSGTTGGSTWTFNWVAPTSNVGNVTFYVAGLHCNGNASESGDQTYTSTKVVTPAAVVVIHHGFSDFDGDGKADPSVFRSTNQTWYVNRSTSGFLAAQFGLATDKLTPADFDGDDKTDIAVWREAPATQAAFYILQSTTNTVRIVQFGQTGDNPVVVGDWDGDGNADPAVYRDSAVGAQSYFYYRGSLSNPGGNVSYLPWGATSDKPMRGDFDGDGKVDAAIFRPSTSTWWIRQSSNAAIRLDAWGLSTDKFVSGDFDGDAKTDLAIFRNGTWMIKQSSNGAAVYRPWGLSTDTLVPADYDGDAKTDVAVYRSGVWYISLSSNGNLSAQSFGAGTDVPVPSVAVQ